jgi:hypothetical protein
MLRLHKIPYFDGKFTWEINSINGSLMKSEHFHSKNKSYSDKLNSAFYYIDNPYELNWSSEPNKFNIELKKIKEINNYNKILFSLGNKNFIISILYSTIGKKYFETTTDSFSYISNLKDHQYGSENCFQRTLLAAKISKSFKKNGVIFIGAELSTFNMHAWIIENNIQPDLEDRVWINYRPLLAITF